MQYYKRFVGLDTTKGLMDRHFPVGLLNIPIVVFYIRYDAEITKQDRIVEIDLDKEDCDKFNVDDDPN